MQERWKPIPRTDGVYEASSFGNIRKVGEIKSCKLLFNRRCGYLYVWISWAGLKKCISVARLVAESFKGRCPPGKEVAHKDDVRVNNCIKNLEYKTHLENVRDTIRRGRASPPPVHFGEKNPSSKLKEKEVLKIRSLYVKGSKKFGSYSLAKIFGVDASVILDIVSKRTWRHL